MDFTSLSKYLKKTPAPASMVKKWTDLELYYPYDIISPALYKKEEGKALGLMILDRDNKISILQVPKGIKKALKKKPYKKIIRDGYEETFTLVE